MFDEIYDEDRDEQFIFSPGGLLALGRPPATGAWRQGDPVGNRKFADLGPVSFEAGGQLENVRIAYETWGEFRGDNAILIPHALTGDSHLLGNSEPGHPSSGWWNGMAGPGSPYLDTDKWFVVCPNVVGGCQGSTGPASLGPDGREYGPRFPYLTVRDQAQVLTKLGSAIGVERWACLIGPSIGGAIALEFMCLAPEQAARFALIAAPAYTRAEHIARNSIQMQIVRADPHFYQGEYYDKPQGPHIGLSTARRLALLHYRGQEELERRFGRSWQSEVSPYGGKGRFAIESYLDFQGNKFVRRFDANSYLTLVAAINSHDITRGRGSLARALSQAVGPSVVVGITSDRLFPVSMQADIAAALPGNIDRGRVCEINSEYGHDGFLLECEQVGSNLSRLLAIPV